MDSVFVRRREDVALQARQIVGLIKLSVGELAEIARGHAGLGAGARHSAITALDAHGGTATGGVGVRRAVRALASCLLISECTGQALLAHGKHARVLSACRASRGHELVASLDAGEADVAEDGRRAEWHDVVQEIDACGGRRERDLNACHDAVEWQQVGTDSVHDSDEGGAVELLRCKNIVEGKRACGNHGEGEGQLGVNLMRQGKTRVDVAAARAPARGGTDAGAVRSPAGREGVGVQRAPCRENRERDVARGNARAAPLGHVIVLASTTDYISNENSF